MEAVPNITSICNLVKVDTPIPLFPSHPGCSCARRVLRALTKQREHASVSSAADNLPQVVATDSRIAKNTDEQIEDTWEKWAIKGKQVGWLHNTPVQDHRASSCSRHELKVKMKALQDHKCFASHKVVL